MPRKPKANAGDKIELAYTYARDGAFHSAARLLREAADMFQATGDKRNAELEKLVGKERAKKPEGEAK
jgi:hypothetical protein